MLYLGDLKNDQVVEFLFHTNDLGSAPATLSGSPSLAVYKTGSTTQSTAGLTLTVDYDSVTGLNHVQVDTSADAFYEAGKDYSLVLAAGTVDGVSVVGKVLATFSIENRNNAANVTQWNGSAVAMPATAGYPAVTIKSGTGTGEIDLSSGTVKLAATTHTGATIPTVTDVTNLHASAATAANQTTILARLGAWTGSGANTILGALRALFRSDSDAAVPTDINADLGSGAGTADNATDSLQAIGASAADVYHADIEYTPDATEGRDEFTATWFKNGVRVASGITSPVIQVVARDDGSDLVAETAMTEVGETGTFAYNESSDRIPVAEAALIIVSATIDGETRSFSKLVTGY